MGRCAPWEAWSPRPPPVCQKRENLSESVFVSMGESETRLSGLCMRGPNLTCRSRPPFGFRPLTSLVNRSLRVKVIFQTQYGQSVGVSDHDPCVALLPKDKHASAI